MTKGLRSRTAVIAFGLALIAVFLLYAFWPRPLAVDIGEVSRQPMMVTIDEEARTRVRDAYVVSAPVTGRLLRVDVEPGDAVIGDETVVARIAPAAPVILDARSEDQARAAVDAAAAALDFARADLARARADAALANAELDRARKLHASDTISEAALDQAERTAKAANAARDAGEAAIRARAAELEKARAMLAAPTDGAGGEAVTITAPISGRILRLMQESETVVAAGAPILEIGDPAGDLEIIAELLSTDAVKTSPGDRVIIEKWGGGETLHGRVTRIEPWGFTKYSALGVEEQRVSVVIAFEGGEELRRRLGHGYRVEARIVIWENDAALAAPSSALFRSGGDWALFVVRNGKARLQTVETGRANGVLTEIVAGLEAGDRIVLYPGSRVADGARVAQRRID